MRRNKIFKTTIAFVLIIYTIVMTVSALNLKRVIDTDMKNLAENLTANVYNSISEQIKQPIYMSKIMASNTFVKDWLQDYADGESDPDQIITYLGSIQSMIQADTVFIISSETGDYYTNKGFNKKVSSSNDHDIWYYIFRDSGKPYDLDVDVDEVHDNRWTVFVNTRMEDDDGNLIGVCGIGIKMDAVQQTIQSYEDAHQLKINLINSEGLVQVDTNSIYIESADLSVVLNNIENNQYKYTAKNNGGFLITKYIDELGWYLVIQCESLPTGVAFNNTVRNELLTFFVLLIISLCGYFYFHQLEQKQSIYAETTDTLTQVANRKYVQYKLEDNLISQYHSLALLDIDFFKQMNDTHGHCYGDEILRWVADAATRICGADGDVVRWGGDEFLLLFKVDLPAANTLCHQLLEESHTKNITLSMGVGAYHEQLTFDDNIKLVDSALYEVKHEGRNNVCVLKD